MTIRATRRPALLAAALLALAGSGLGGCAGTPASTDPEAVAQAREANDPYEGANRFFYKIDDGLDTYVLRPVAVAYRTVVPGAVRRPVHNLLDNLVNPVRFANDVIQGKPRRAGDTLMRFVINSTAGAAGLFDVASEVGYERHSTDFGVTLALWGVGEGPFLFLPVLGPSNPRDASGFGVDLALDPLTYATFGGSTAVELGRFGLGAVDTRERLIDPIDGVKRTALDPYATFRSLYRQNRQSEIDGTRDDRRATVPAWFKR